MAPLDKMAREKEPHSLWVFKDLRFGVFSLLVLYKEFYNSTKALLFFDTLNFAVA